MNRKIAWAGLLFAIFTLASSGLVSVGLQDVPDVNRGIIFDALTLAVPFIAALAGGMIRHFGEAI